MGRGRKRKKERKLSNKKKEKKKGRRRRGRRDEEQQEPTGRSSGRSLFREELTELWWYKMDVLGCLVRSVRVAVRTGSIRRTWVIVYEWHSSRTSVPSLSPEKETD
ncbi:hypothetical protein LZ31DRAFT_103627 [Colletotrichum somersetense]|nr:hypothetical protein LZ31DRAFT_103627 [Colletotrichum somersetense]